jgi:hypothetical protein
LVDRGRHHIDRRLNLHDPLDLIFRSSFLVTASASAKDRRWASN